MATTGRFVWFDYVSNHEKKAQAFFGELFHWKTQEVPTPGGSYTMILLGNETIGGYLQPAPRGPQQARWLSLLGVDSAQDTALQVRSLGGFVTKEPEKIGEAGTLAIVTDPLGGELGLWQSAKPVATAGEYKNLEGAWIWNQLYTEDVDRSVAFYKAIGGFSAEPMKLPPNAPGPSRYDILSSQGKGRAGVMKMTGAVQSWMPYVQVANADATVEKTKKLGGTIKAPAETMAGVGRLAVLIDPLGAPLGILQPLM